MIQTPTMQLPKPEAGDPMEPFFLGTQPDGGYWTTMTRLSEHDHTGGLNGKTLTAATIPDGSITPSKLAPSVYAPLTFVDGSKPFTGTQEFQADAIVRDALLFGQQGSALAPDVTLTRTGAGALQLDGALTATKPVLVQGATGAYLFAARDGASIWQWYASQAGGAQLYQQSAAFNGNRAAIGPTGTLTLTPDANAHGLQTILTGTGAGVYCQFVGGAGASWTVSHASNIGAGYTQITSGVGGLALFGAGGYVLPAQDNGLYMGHPSYRWNSMYSTNGVVTGSSQDLKEDIAPLDPAAATAAVRATDPVTFTYTAPARPPEWYALPDDPEAAERELLMRLTAGPLEAAARQQAGFVLQDGSGTYHTDPLFETGSGQSNAANTCGVLLAALRDLDTRLQALETP